MIVLTVVKVWSFSPKADEIEDYRSASPASMPDRDIEYGRPQSAMLPSASSAPMLPEDGGDVTMADVVEA
jgi:F-box and WD-40 domain protein CDC4